MYSVKLLKQTGAAVTLRQRRRWGGYSCGVDSSEEPLRNPKHSSAPFRTPLRNALVVASLSDISPFSPSLSPSLFTFLRPPTVCCGLFSTCHVTPAPRRSCWRRLERWWLLTRTHAASTSRACPTSRPASRSRWGTVSLIEPASRVFSPSCYCASYIAITHSADCSHISLCLTTTQPETKPTSGNELDFFFSWQSSRLSHCIMISPGTTEISGQKLTRMTRLENKPCGIWWHDHQQPVVPA